MTAPLMPCPACGTSCRFEQVIDEMGVDERYVSVMEELARELAEKFKEIAEAELPLLNVDGEFKPNYETGFVVVQQIAKQVVAKARQSGILGDQQNGGQDAMGVTK